MAGAVAGTRRLLVGAIGVGDSNPYEAPRAALDAPGTDLVDDAPEAEETWLWRDGPLLVIRKGAEWPDRCVRCGEPAGGTGVEHWLIRHPPWYFLLLLLGIAPYFIGLSIGGRMAKVRLGLCPAHRSRFRAVNVAAGLMALLGVAAISVTVADDRLWPMTPIGCILIVIGSSHALRMTCNALARPRRIIRRFAWITVHPGVLEGLAEWPSTEAA